jgi:hypothetical protein
MHGTAIKIMHNAIEERTYTQNKYFIFKGEKIFVVSTDPYLNLIFKVLNFLSIISSISKTIFKNTGL